MEIIILIVGVVIVYFLPTIVALTTKNINVSSILIVNLFLGWTLVGWVVALAWAFKK